MQWQCLRLRYRQQRMSIQLWKVYTLQQLSFESSNVCSIPASSVTAKPRNSRQVKERTLSHCIRYLCALAVSLLRMEDVVGLLERQVTEIEAVHATFREPGEFVLEPSERNNLAQAQQALLRDHDRPWFPSHQPLSGRISLLDAVLHHSPVSLRFTLPTAYPQVPPLLQVC